MTPRNAKVISKAGCKAGRWFQNAFPHPPHAARFSNAATRCTAECRVPKATASREGASFDGLRMSGCQGRRTAEAQRRRGEEAKRRGGEEARGRRGAGAKN